MKGKRQLDATSEISPSEIPGLRSAVNAHVRRLAEAMDGLRRNLRRLESRLDSEELAAEPLAACLADTRSEIDRIYDTMIRVRWAALGVPSAPLADAASNPAALTEEVGPVTETSATIYIVDDNASVRKALSRLFRSLDFEVEAFPSARKFLEAEPAGHPACVVLDVRMPRMSGLDLQHELAQRDSDLPIVFITGHGDIDMAVQAMKDGAVDFLPKPFDDQDLIDSVERALRHHHDIREISDRHDEIKNRMARLTPREQEVFERVIKGMLNKQIGFELGTTEKTIKVHRARVMEKMEAESLADLVRMAERLGIEGPAPAEED